MFELDIVGGHSLGGNVVLLEMPARGEFDGPVLLLSPTFSREDEARELGVLDRLGAVPGVGQLAWLAMLKALPKAMGKRFPAERREALVAGMANNDPRFCRRACAPTSNISTLTARSYRACVSRGSSHTSFLR